MKKGSIFVPVFCDSTNFLTINRDNEEIHFKDKAALSLLLVSGVLSQVLGSRIYIPFSKTCDK